MSIEQPPQHGGSAAGRAVLLFIVGFIGTLVLLFVGLMLGGPLFNSVPAAIVLTILVGSSLIIVGAMNRSRPIVAGGVTAFAIVAAVFGGCLMMFMR